MQWNIILSTKSDLSIALGRPWTGKWFSGTSAVFGITTHFSLYMKECYIWRSNIGFLRSVYMLYIGIIKVIYIKYQQTFFHMISETNESINTLWISTYCIIKVYKSNILRFPSSKLSLNLSFFSGKRISNMHTCILNNLSLSLLEARKDHY